MAVTQDPNVNRKIRYAVVGLGWFAQAAALPAFAQAENSELVALISDDPIKRAELIQKYGLQHSYSYEEYDDFLMSGAVDAVYIALPNHLHCDYTLDLLLNREKGSRKEATVLLPFELSSNQVKVP